MVAEEDRISTINHKAEKNFQSVILGQTPSDREIWRKMNWSKNTVKHMSDGNPHIMLNPIVEAQKWIEMAIINHNKIGFPKSDMILKFEARLAQKVEKAFISLGYKLSTVNDLGMEAEADDEDDEIGGQFGGQN